MTIIETLSVTFQILNSLNSQLGLENKWKIEEF